MNTQKQIVLIVALLFIFTGGCAAYTAIELPVRAVDQAEWTRDQSLERGALLFANNCRTCHGNKGQGGVGPQLLNAELTQFQDQDPLTLRNNRALLTKTLSCGRASTLMPAWLSNNGGSLNAIQIQHLVNFLTSPIEVTDEGEATSHWWEEAEHFAHNLNAEVAVLVGGDTLGTIAKAHGIGPRELSAENGNRPINERIKKGTEIKIPGFRGDENGYTYTVYKDNETIQKIAESQLVGTLIIADLNDIPYEFSEKRGATTLQLKTADGQDVAGLFPGVELELPEGATYTLQAGDTLQALADKHGISVNDIVSPNRDLLGGLAATDEIPFERRLELPNAIVIVQQGQELEAIAEAHGLEVADLAEANGLGEADAVTPGQELTLPSGTEYIVQAGDTWALVAQEHGLGADGAAQLAQLNDSDPNSTLTADVTIQIPKVDGYVVQGQDLEAVAGGYGNVTAASLAEANGVEANTILAVGTQLHLPDDAFGSAAPDAVNPGTACVQGTVPQEIWDIIQGVEVIEITEPEEISTDVLIEANSNDWTITADGVTMPPNGGGVKVAIGTVINFVSVVGLHTITLNDEKEGNDINTGDERSLTFNDPGEFTLTCDYHSAMEAIIWVE